MQLSRIFDNIMGERYRIKEQDITAIEFDSRKVRPGALFVALSGDRYDGHDFVKSALEKGARALVVQKRMDADIPQFIVPDTRAVLGKIARNFYGGFPDMTKIAITGTNGKTTTSFLIRSILEMSGRKTALIGTIYYIGRTKIKAVRTTPESLDIFKLMKGFHDQGMSALVMEVSSHALALKRVDELRFKAGVFTNLSQDHLDFHHSMDHYRQTKLRIFSLLEPGGWAIFNMDDPTSDSIKELGLKHTLTYGMINKSDVRARIIEDTIDGLNIEINHAGRDFMVRSQLIGTYNVYNILGAFSVALCLDIGPDTAVRGIGEVKCIKGRMEPIAQNIFIDYAHTPSALEQALISLKQYTRGRLIIVFGCGGDRDIEKRPQMGAAATRLADLTIITSDNPRSESPQRIIDGIVNGVVNERYRIIENREQAIKTAIREKKDEDILLIAGKGHEDYQIIGDKVTAFDDAEVIRKCTTRS
jgi:UDP-N-acetylmuramoyl-L-alanyl-D-glutamate--2,6-diaminopimelate ligase